MCLRLGDTCKGACTALEGNGQEKLVLQTMSDWRGGNDLPRWEGAQACLRPHQGRHDYSRDSLLRRRISGEVHESYQSSRWLLCTAAIASQKQQRDPKWMSKVRTAYEKIKIVTMEGIAGRTSLVDVKVSESSLRDSW